MSALEQHYKIPQIAKMWAMSDDFVRSVFKDEPGVVRISRPETRRKRGYTTMSVPESVLLKVHKRITS